jgi:multidrug resistance efflux pump
MHDEPPASGKAPATVDATPKGAGGAGPEEPRNPVRRWVLITLGVIAVLVVYHVVADRLTPYSAQVYVQTFVVDIAAEVSGPVVEVGVDDNSDVAAGQELLRIDPARFEIAVAAAEAALASAGQSIGASTAAVAAAQAQLTAAQANLTNVREQSARTFALVERGIMAAARRDDAQAELDTAEAAVQQAQAAVEEARQLLGPEGDANPQIRAAVADLEAAQLDLIRSTVRAPSDGLITNLQLSVGQFAQAGAAMMTFIDTRSVSVVAELRERSLENIKPGDAAEVAFDVLPGRVFAAKVESIGWGVSLGADRSRAGLPSIGEETGWLRASQRFPVLLAFERELPPDSVRVGSLGAAVVYTGEHAIMNALAWLRMRLVSLLSYVY